MANDVNSENIDLSEEDRGIPVVGSRPSGGGSNVIGFIFICLCVVAFGVFLFVKFGLADEDETTNDTAPKQVEAVKTATMPQRTFDFAPADDPVPTPSPVPEVKAEPPPEVKKPPVQGKPAVTISKSGRGLLLGNGSGASSGHSGGQSREVPFQAENEARLRQAEQALLASTSNQAASKGALGGMLEGTETPRNFASYLVDRNYLIAQGTVFQCALQTKIVTAVAGMTRCVVPYNIYSDNGNTLLIERGSEINGEYKAGLQQGVPRIFVLWTRVKTPSGVIVSLASPGTGQLGEGGIDGYVDTHFWKRFGGGIMLSVIDDLGNALVEQSDSSVDFGSTQKESSRMAEEALRNSINIPPTLYKNQGEAVAIYLARDIDFRTVYELANE